MIAVFSDKYPDAVAIAANRFLTEELPNDTFRELKSMSVVIDSVGHYVLTIHYDERRYSLDHP